MVDSTGKPALKRENGFALLAVLGVSLALFLFALAAVHHLIGVQARLKHELFWPLQVETFRDSLVYRDRFLLPSTIRDIQAPLAGNALSWRRYAWHDRDYVARWRHAWSTDVALRVENERYPLMFTLATNIRGIIQVDRDDVYLHLGSEHMREAVFRVGAPWSDPPAWDLALVSAFRRSCDAQLETAAFGRRGGIVIEDSTLVLTDACLAFRDSLQLVHCTLTGAGSIACGGPLRLAGCRVMKGAEVYAAGVLSVDDSTSYSECLLYSAQGCELGGLAAGYAQIATPGYLEVRAHTRMRGPNDLLVLPGTGAAGSRRIRLRDHASVEGNLLFLSEREPIQDGGVVLELNSVVTGLVMSDTWVDPQGTVRGSLITRRLGVLDEQGARTTSEMGFCNLQGPAHERKFDLPPLFQDARPEPSQVLEER